MLITKEDAITFPSRLTYALDELKISQAELGRKIGVNRQSIQYLCAEGIKERRSKHAFQIARALKISPEWLIVGEGEMVSENLNINKELLHELAEAIYETYIGDGEEHLLNIAIKIGMIEKRVAIKGEAIDCDGWHEEAEGGETIYRNGDIEEMVKQIEGKSK